MQASATVIPGTILKFLPVYRRNIFEKQLSQLMSSKNLFRLFHAPKIQIVSTKLNMRVKVVRYLSKSEATVNRC